MVIHKWMISQQSLSAFGLFTQAIKLAFKILITSWADNPIPGSWKKLKRRHALFLVLLEFTMSEHITQAIISMLKSTDLLFFFSSRRRHTRSGKMSKRR